jgi:hypothetical protein
LIRIVDRRRGGRVDVYARPNIVYAPRAGARQTLRLEALFIRTAYAQENPTAFDLGAYLDQEAGISAYYKSPDAITLSQVRGQFRTIEAETADYIIGSVAVPNHSENFDAHVYVHTTGWILAYYLRADPISRSLMYILDNQYDEVETVVSIIASAAGAPFTDVTYYDFRYLMRRTCYSLLKIMPMDMTLPSKCLDMAILSEGAR